MRETVLDRMSLEDYSKSKFIISHGEVVKFAHDVPGVPLAESAITGKRLTQDEMAHLQRMEESVVILP